MIYDLPPCHFERSDLYRATLAVARGLGFFRTHSRNRPLRRRVRQSRGYEVSIFFLTSIFRERFELNEEFLDLVLHPFESYNYSILHRRYKLTGTLQILMDKKDICTTFRHGFL